MWAFLIDKEISMNKDLCKLSILNNSNKVWIKMGGGWLIVSLINIKINRFYPKNKQGINNKDILKNLHFEKPDKENRIKILTESLSLQHIINNK